MELEAVAFHFKFPCTKNHVQVFHKNKAYTCKKDRMPEDRPFHLKKDLLM